MKLSDIVRPDRMVARSVNLERDMNDPAGLDRYLLTGKGLEIVRRLAAGLNGEKVSAWSLTGPYGMGKSAFVHFLLSICGGSGEAKARAARQKLAEKDNDLTERLDRAFRKRGVAETGLFRVPATAAFEPVNRTLGNALARAMGESAEPSDEFNALRADVAEWLDNGANDGSRLVAFFREAVRICRTPVAVVVDEFGKNLEYLARNPATGDLFVLQSLAETDGVFLWVCLHQAFEAYAAGLTRNQRREWGKVQGRFEDIAFVEPRPQMLDFIERVLARVEKRPDADAPIQKWASFFHAEAQRPATDEIADLLPERLAGLFPLHPLAAVLLPELCTRFAQNDRTLFAFLCAGEPNGLPAFLHAAEFNAAGPAPPTFGPERLYDYFLGSNPALSLSRPGASRWLEIREIVEGARSLPERQQRLLRIIGMLNLVSGPSGFRASRNLLRFALSAPDTGDRDAADAELAALSEKGLLIYREYADEFRLWEGTDIDIPAAIERQKPMIAARPLPDLLEKTAPLLPLTASRHSYRTGTLRHFARRWCAAEGVAEAVAGFDGNAADGLLLYLFGNDEPMEPLPARTPDGYPVLVAFAREEYRLRERLLDAAAAKAILAEVPELDRDGVARREAKFRAGAAEQRLKQFLDELYTPGNPDVTWMHGEERFDLKSARDLSHRLSMLCDETFDQCPVIRNELINRERLSSAAARARRELIEAMLTGENRENLGLSGTGPEVAMYRTMLAAEGLHGPDEDVGWRFYSPDRQSSFRAAWEAIDAAMERAGDAPLPLPELISVLREPPFGMKSGPIPVLISLYLMVLSEEIAVYQEGAFIPYLTPEDLDLMVKRPEYFAIRRFSPLGIQGKVFRIYQEMLNASAVGDHGKLRNATIVGIVGPLVQFADELPPYVKQTRTISPVARRLLQTMLNSKDPIQLLLEDLPAAVGFSAIEGDESLSGENLREFQIRFRDAIAELVQAFEGLVERIRMILQETFQSTISLTDFRNELERRAKPLVARCADARLKPFVAALAKNGGGNREWVTRIATIAGQRPVASWRDTDLNGFSTRMHDLAKRFMALERLAAEEERRLPEGESGKEARLVSLARPDGRMESEILWIDVEDVERSKETVERLVRENGTARLRALFVMLGEHLLGEKAEE